MKDRSYSTPLAVTLALVVVAAAALLQAFRLLAEGMSVTSTLLLLLLIPPALALALAITWLLGRINDSRAGQLLRAAVTLLFCVSLATTLALGVLIKLPLAGVAPGAVPANHMLALMVAAAASVLSTPVGWRTLVQYVSRRSTAAMPFFQASPVTLCFAFVAATGVAVALGSSDFIAMAATGIGANAFSTLGITLLVSLSLVIPLLLLARLLRISGGWLRQRWAAR